MTERLYYRDSFLYEFEAEVLAMDDGSGASLRQSSEQTPPGGTAILHDRVRQALILDRTAFYPTSGGQVFDTGWILAGDESRKSRVTEVAEREDGTILHFVENVTQLQKGNRVRGLIDVARRRDHMQQHSGQHVLSAAFVRLFDIPTVSFHMGADYCSIDLETRGVTTEQVEAAEALANDVVTENRPVEIRFVSQEEARALGLRKAPPTGKDELRLIDIHDFDLTACGGTHVSSTGQIGCIVLRKTEKVRQGWRVEFVCGKRAVATARRDFTVLTEAAGLLSSHIWEVPKQVRKAQEESRAWRKSAEQILEELAGVYASRLLDEASDSGGRKIVVRTFPDRDLTFIKLLAQRMTRQGPAVVALLAVTSGQPALVFAQSAGQPFDMGALMKDALARLGGHGGGSKDTAQGGPAKVEGLETILAEIAGRLRS